MKAYIEHLQSLSPKRLILLLAQKRQQETEALAIVGAACRMPGAIGDLEQLWQHLRDGRCSVETYPDGPPGPSGRTRWKPEHYGEHSALRVGAFLRGIDAWPSTVELADDEALYVDPQHRLLLACAHEALADTGLGADGLRGERVGIFVGISHSEYLHASLHGGLTSAQLSAYMGTGTALSAAAGRLALALGSQGPALAVDTACSSALTALHLAKNALRRGECDWAVVAASHLLLSPLTSLVFAQAGMLSASGRIRPFDAEADGHVRGEGAGLLLLCHRSLAQRQQLPVKAWLRGCAVHQQGARPALAGVSGVGQLNVIREAMQDAQLGPEDVHVVEAQANGARIGARIELESLETAYRREAPLYVGSAKANWGYLETASGMASLLKAIVLLQQRQLPPQIHCTTPDPEFAWHKSHLRLSLDGQPLPAHGPLRCAVSSFGFTGTYAHAILESAEARAYTPPLRAPQGASLWPHHNFWK